MTNRADALREYHERTKHSPTSVRRDAHFLDWDNQPRPFKIYVDLEPIPLPTELPGSQMPALAALAPVDGRVAAPARLDVAVLARLLYFSAGVLRRKTYPGGEVFFRAAACTGALYHVDVYAVCADLPDLPAGVYHFGPHDFALRRLRAGDHRATLVAAAAGEPAVAAAPVVLVLTSTFWRNAWKYRTRTYRHCYWDAGTLLANLFAAAASVHLPARAVLGFADATVNTLVGIEPAHEAALALIPLGSAVSPPPDPPPVEPLVLETLPLSAREVDYPIVPAAHAASSLASAEEVAAWRARGQNDLAPLETRAGVALTPVPAAAVAQPIESVVLRRGSSRRFPRVSIPREALATVVASASHPVTLDVPVRPDLYVIVNAVDGLAPGAYVADGSGQALELLREGDFRRDAGHLDLDQALGADAAVNLYWLVDLERVFGRLGARGYRAAQLAAAVAGGKAYLAAYAIGLGATGLTFYDDEVTDFFSPHATGKAVMFLVAIGRRLPHSGN